MPSAMKPTKRSLSHLEAPVDADGRKTQKIYDPVSQSRFILAERILPSSDASESQTPGDRAGFINKWLNDVTTELRVPTDPLLAAAGFTVPHQTPQTTPADDPKEAKRVRSSNYRTELSNHHIYIDSYGLTMPKPIQDHVRGIIGKSRTSHGLSEKAELRIRSLLASSSDIDKSAMITIIIKTQIFPRKSEYKISANDSAIAIGSKSFDRTALPYIPGVDNSLAVTTPEPDLHYGYARENFEAPLALAGMSDVIDNHRILPYAKPTSTDYWPFFAIQLKSRSQLGSFWVAENQNAGTGAHCVNAVETLMKYAGVERNSTDSVAFTCAIDCDMATLWVHWRELRDENPSGTGARFVSAEVDGFCFKRPGEIRRFYASLRNIMDWALGERLSKLKDALSKLVPEVSNWVEKDTKP